ncbi:MAG: TonB-dependent receptor [Bacteroidales bacterium]|nr:TonB-dependent receptor [Bacteroidales bacterium]
MIKRFIAIIFLLTVMLSVSAQSTIKGFVYDASSGEPVGYCPVVLQGTSYGAMTESTGNFIMDKIPNGTYVLTINFLGYDTYRDTIDVQGRTVIKRYMIQPSKVSLDEVQVSGAADRQIQETRSAVISITPKEISKMPAIGGQPDFAQYLQVLPGVISTGDQGGQLYVRGGTPIQNMLLLDGMIVFNPFHSIGLFSVFDMDIMSSADIYTGGFGAEFGGRISSVMNIKTRDGNKKRLSGKIDLSNIGAQVLLEGPIVKLKDDRKTSLSFILSGKGSYLAQAAKVFYPYVKNESGLPYNFMDIYGKLTLASQGGSKLNVFGFNFMDKVNYTSALQYSWNNWGVGANFLIVPGQANTTIEGTFAYSDYESKINDPAYQTEGEYSKYTHTGGFNFNLVFNYYVGRSIFNIGLNAVGFNTVYKYWTKYGNKEYPKDYTTDLSLFVKYKYNYKNILLIEPSFRLQYYTSLSKVSPEPRLAIKYNITKNIRLKLSGGMYSQNYISVTSDRDVVNLFYGYVSSPSSLDIAPILPNGKTAKNRLQTSEHAVLGLELDVLKYTSINVEGYYKHFSQIISVNRYMVDEQNDEPFMWEQGHAYGGDISIKFEYKGLYLWGVYSLGWVKRTDPKVTYAPNFDRRHNINILASYAFGKRRSWQIDLRWNFGSGFPFTQTQAFYPNFVPSTGIGDDIIQANEDLDFVLDDLNKGRLPNYHRLDLGVKKKFFIGERHSIEVSASLTNVYNYSNVFYVNRITNDVVYQLPFLYYFGLNWRF